MRFGMGDIPIDKLSQNQPGGVANSGCICSVNKYLDAVNQMQELYEYRVISEPTIAMSSIAARK